MEYIYAHTHTLTVIKCHSQVRCSPISSFINWSHINIHAITGTSIKRTLETVMSVHQITLCSHYTSLTCAVINIHAVSDESRFCAWWCDVQWEGSSPADVNWKVSRRQGSKILNLIQSTFQRKTIVMLANSLEELWGKCTRMQATWVCLFWLPPSRSINKHSQLFMATSVRLPNLGLTPQGYKLIICP